MKTSLVRRSRLAFEHLESKQMLAGDVAVSVIDGNLIVEGDEFNNQIAITAGEQPGQYIIRGLEGTLVHLTSPTDPPPAEEILPGSVVVVEGVRHNVRIGMGAGDDLVMIHDAGFRGNVGIGTDGGDDTVRIGVRPNLPTPMPEVSTQLTDAVEDTVQRPSVVIRGNLTIATGAQNDTVQIPNAFVVGHLQVGAGEGNDRVHLGPRLEESAPMTVVAKARIEMPPLTVGRGTTVELGAGTDGFVARAVRSPYGVEVFGGEGRDEIVLQHVQAGKRLSVDSGPGAGADFVGLTGVEARSALVKTGAGNDVVQITDSAFGLLAVLLEAGDDKLTLRGVKSRSALLSGGDGEDTLTLLGENLLGIHIIDGFEDRGTAV